MSVQDKNRYITGHKNYQALTPEEKAAYDKDWKAAHKASLKTKKVPSKKNHLIAMKSHLKAALSAPGQELPKAHKSMARFHRKRLRGKMHSKAFAKWLKKPKTVKVGESGLNPFTHPKEDQEAFRASTAAHLATDKVRATGDPNHHLEASRLHHAARDAAAKAQAAYSDLGMREHYGRHVYFHNHMIEQHKKMALKSWLPKHESADEAEGNEGGLTRDHINTVRELLKSNTELDALRHIRRVTGCGLAVAKTAIQDIKSRRPWTFPKK